MRVMAPAPRACTTGGGGSTGGGGDETSAAAFERRLRDLLHELRVDAELVLLPGVAGAGAVRFDHALNRVLRDESHDAAVAMLPLPPLPPAEGGSGGGGGSDAAYVARLRLVTRGLPPAMLICPGEDTVIVTTEI